MKKVLSIIGLLVIVIIPLLGCSESAPAATSSIVGDIAQIKAKEPIWDSYGPRLVAVEGRASGSAFDAQPLKDKDASLQSQIDTMKADYQAKIDALTTKVANLTPGVGGGQPTSPIGTVQFTNNPVAIPQIFSSSAGGNSNPWIMTINNQSTTWQYVKPMVSLNVASGQPSSIVSDVSLMTSGGSCSLTGTLLVPGNFTFSPSNMTTVATPSVIIFPINGCNGSGEFYIGPGQSQSYNIQIQGLKTPNPILWNVSCTISSRSM
jgi:hypothetical protein